MTIPSVLETGIEVGNDAGWALAFYTDRTEPPATRR